MEVIYEAKELTQGTRSSGDWKIIGGLDLGQKGLEAAGGDLMT